MRSLRHLFHRTLTHQTCTRSLHEAATLTSEPAGQTVHPQPFIHPRAQEVLPVPSVDDHMPGKGEHYSRSYRKFTSWLNSGGTAEVYEGCLIVGRVLKVINKKSMNSQRVKKIKKLENRMKMITRSQASTSAFDREDAKLEEKIQRLKSTIRELKGDDIGKGGTLLPGDGMGKVVLMIDWGHKHLGYALIEDTRMLPCPRPGDHVTCKLHSMEKVHLPMGHQSYERHNEAELEYIKTLETREILEINDHPSPTYEVDNFSQIDVGVQELLDADNDSEDGSGIKLLPNSAYLFVLDEDRKVDLQKINKLDVFIDNTFSGLVIGKKFKNIILMRSEFGVDVKVDFDKNLVDGKRRFTLSAPTNGAIKLALKRLEERLAFFMGNR